MFRVKISNFISFFRKVKSKENNLVNFLNQKNYPVYFFALIVFFIIYALIANQIKSYSKFKENNFNSFLNSNEFSNIKNSIFENLKSPYKEYYYTVENNDTIEKVLKKFNIPVSDINKIATEIIKKKLSNIFADTEIKIVTKNESGFKPCNQLC